MNEYTIKLLKNELEYLVSCMTKRPLEECLGLFNKINEQIKNQQTPETKKASDVS